MDYFQGLMPGEGVASSENKEEVVVLGTCDYPVLLDKHSAQCQPHSVRLRCKQKHWCIW